jgi:hypothetical protein
MAGYFHLAATGQVECRLRKPPQIHVAASDTKVVYDHSKSQAQLDNFENDTISPYGPNVRSHVGGLMSGEVSVSQNIKIMQETWANINSGCLYIDTVKVDIHIKPTIYIANHYKKSGCMYHAIMEHEKKHIQVDRMIVNKYTNIIIKALDTNLKKIGYSHGPYTLQQLPQVQTKLQKYTQDIVRSYADVMSNERQKLQQEVDSLAEYQRVQNSCRGKP